ncbi:MAG: sulfite exporter TauE/SafE family protein [Gammaproteobacteria bacterium]|nr:sulfite exporter TauE/SafE family protein [Gammaproteobacteria bacterium]
MELLIAALLMGFLGGGHCVAMCGSLSMAVGFSVPRDKNFILYSFFISLGRILGYGAIGFIASVFMQSIVGLTSGGVFVLSIISSILMIGIGLHIARINSLVLYTEKLGTFIQPIIDPIKKRLLPIDSIPKCMAYGLFWGLLPCGLVYTALSMSLTAPNALLGGLVMFMFGLGTLPTLVGLTAFNSKLNSILEQSYVRLFLGSIVILMALFNLFMTLQKTNSFS